MVRIYKLYHNEEFHEFSKVSISNHEHNLQWGKQDCSGNPSQMDSSKYKMFESNVFI